MATDEEVISARKESAFYCPGCGRGFEYPAQCVGQSPEAPHRAIQTVATDELSGDDTSKHTAAPPTEGV